jgi:hypothetical protein
MRDAAAVLKIIRDRGRRGLPLERLYRCLFNPDLFLLAYGKIYRNAGAMTPGATGETVDGMTLGKIEAIIGALRAERYRWTPVRRTYIGKKNSSKKRLGFLEFLQVKAISSRTLTRPPLRPISRLAGESTADPHSLRPMALP